MTMKDMHSSVQVLTAIYPRAVGTTGAANGVTSPVLDRKGYRSVEFFYQAGGSASAADTVTPVVLEADATNGSFASVAAGDLLGTEAALTLATAAGQVGRVGYRGSKRYLKLKLYGVGTATALVAAQAVLGNPHVGPVT